MAKYGQGSRLPSAQAGAEGKARCRAGVCLSCPKPHGRRGADELCWGVCAGARREVYRLPLVLSASEPGLPVYCLEQVVPATPRNPGVCMVRVYVFTYIIAHTGPCIYTPIHVCMCCCPCFPEQSFHPLASSWKKLWGCYTPPVQGVGSSLCPSV